MEPAQEQLILKLKIILSQAVSLSADVMGNTQGISKLVVGRPVDEVIQCLDGIDCNGRGTSCPAQLAEALKEYKAAHQ